MNFQELRNVSPAKLLKLSSTAGSSRGLTLVSRGYWNTDLKLPISQERMVSIDLHGIYSPTRYEALFTSKEFLGQLWSDLPILEDGIMFLGESNYWHFLMNGIATLGYALSIKKPIIYIDEAITAEQESFMMAVASLAGTELPTVQRIPAGNYLLKNVAVPWVDRQPLRNLRALIKEYSDRNRIQGETGKRIYVTRATASTRRLVNEADVIEEIRRHHDFEVVDCSTMSIHEQISLFRGANMVVGPHGAGLTNAVYMKAPVLVAEFYHSWKQPFFEWLASGLNCGYRAIEGTKQAGFELDRQDNGDFLVDPSLVLNALEVAKQESRFQA